MRRKIRYFLSTTTYITNIYSGGGVALRGLLSLNSLKMLLPVSTQRKDVEDEGGGGRMRVVEGLPLNDIPHWFQSSALAFYFIFFFLVSLSADASLSSRGVCLLLHHKTSALSSFSPSPTVSLLFDQHPDTQTHEHHPPAPLPGPVCCCRAANAPHFIYLFINLFI